MFAAEGLEGSFGWEEGFVGLELEVVDEGAGFGLHGDCDDDVGDGHCLLDNDKVMNMRYEFDGGGDGGAADCMYLYHTNHCMH